MARYWPGRSLLELYRGDMSWRELRVFLRGLPADSLTAKAISPEGSWTLDQHLAALQADRLGELIHLTLLVNTDPKKRRSIKPPPPIPRPGIEPPKRSNVIRFGGRHGSGAKQLAAVFGGASGQ